MNNDPNPDQKAIPRLSNRQRKLAERQRLAVAANSTLNHSAFRELERNFRRKDEASIDFSRVIDFACPDSRAKFGVREVILQHCFGELDPVTFVHDNSNTPNTDPTAAGITRAYTLDGFDGLIVIPNPFTPTAQRSLVRDCLCEFSRAVPTTTTTTTNDINTVDPNSLSLSVTKTNLHPFWKNINSTTQSLFEKLLEEQQTETTSDLLQVVHSESFGCTDSSSCALSKTNQPEQHQSNLDNGKEQKQEQKQEQEQKDQSDYLALTKPKSKFYTSNQSATDLVDHWRWTTFGLEYNWSTKSYNNMPANSSNTENANPPVYINPKIQHLFKTIIYGVHNAHLQDNNSASADQQPENKNNSTTILNDYDPKKYFVEAGIINYYNPTSCLLAHVDKSEVNMDAPLVSISLGCSCIYLLSDSGTNEYTTDCPNSSSTNSATNHCKDGKDGNVIPIRLRSGDILVCCKRVRSSYHGVPKIFANTCPSFLLDPELPDEKTDTYTTNSTDPLSWLPFANYISNHRININARQCF